MFNLIGVTIGVLSKFLPKFRIRYHIGDMKTASLHINNKRTIITQYYFPKIFQLAQILVHRRLLV